MTLPSLTRRILPILLLLLWLSPAALAQSQIKDVDPLIDWPMFPHPPNGSFQVEFHPRLKGIWKSALEQPAGDTRRLTLDAILADQAAGMKDLDDLKKPVEAVLDQADQLSLRLVAARTLIVLDDRDSASRLLALANQDGLDMILAVDPGLAHWKYQPAAETWRRRLDENGTPPAARLSAITSLGELGDPTAADPLRAIVGNPAEPPTHRLAAARAVGKLNPPGAEEFANNLLAQPATGEGPAYSASLNRLLAAGLLVNSRTPTAREVLVRLAQDREPSVAAAALQSLLAWDPAAVEGLAPHLLENPDASVRRLAAQPLVDRPSPASIRLIAQLLDDPIPGVRAWVRDNLIRLHAKAALAPTIEEVAVAMIDGSRWPEIKAGTPAAYDHWRAREQAILLAGKLGLKQASAQLAELMATHPRHEVRLAAIVVLRWLAVPDTYSFINDRAQALQKLGEKAAKDAFTWYEARKADEAKRIRRVKTEHDIAPRDEMAWYDLELAQAFQALGAAQYKDAEKQARDWVPKASRNRGMGNSRLAGIWAASRMHPNEAEATLTAALVTVATDIGLQGEAADVQLQAVEGLGHMGAKQALASVKQRNPGATLWVAWALDPTMAPLPPSVVYHSEGFLEPLPEQ